MSNAEYIELKPTWTAAVQIYIAVLEDGTEEGKRAARAELLRLAQWADKVMAEQAKEAA